MNLGEIAEIGCEQARCTRYLALQNQQGCGCDIEAEQTTDRPQSARLPIGDDRQQGEHQKEHRNEGERQDGHRQSEPDHV